MLTEKNVSDYGLKYDCTVVVDMGGCLNTGFHLFEHVLMVNIKQAPQPEFTALLVFHQKQCAAFARWS